MNFENAVGMVVAGISVVFAVSAIIGAMRAGVLTRLRLGNFLDIQTTQIERQEARAVAEALAHSQEAVPFETEQLARYYGQILAQSKISFWFSLIFASLGFAVIIVAVFLYASSPAGATVAQFAAGVVMDSVAALFFVQSRNAQKSMGEFFDKLRRDRQQLESRKLCESLDNSVARDALRIQLSLHYAEVATAPEVAKSIFNTALPRADGLVKDVSTVTVRTPPPALLSD
jgi:hypothetical protein